MEEKKTNPIKFGIITGIGGLVLGAGIMYIVLQSGHPGAVTTTTNNPTTTTTAPATSASAPNTPSTVGQVPLQSHYSSSMYAKLSDYSKRVQHATQLPLPAKGDNVLYLSPASGYAISQLHQVWSKLPTITVVWIDTTAQQSQTDWAKLGYKTNPLPSPTTQYVKNMIPEPDAYHHTKTGWIELPGILRPNQTNDWITFYHAK